MPSTTVTITVTTSSQVNVALTGLTGAIDQSDRSKIDEMLKSARQLCNADDVMQMRLNMLEFQIKRGRSAGVKQALAECVKDAREDQWKLRCRQQQKELTLRAQLKKLHKHARRPGKVTCKTTTVVTITTRVTTTQKCLANGIGDLDALHALHRMCMFDAEVAEYIEDMIERRERTEDVQGSTEGLLALLTESAWEARRDAREEAMKEFNDIRDAANEVVEDFFDAAEDFAEDVFGFIGMTAAHIDDTMDQWQQQISDFSDGVQNEIEDFSDAVDAQIDDARREIEEAVDDIKEGLDELAEGLMEFLTDLKRTKDEIVEFFNIITSINPLDVLECMVRRKAYKLQHYYGSLKILSFLNNIDDPQAKGIAIFAFFLLWSTLFYMFLGTSALVTLFMYPIPMVESLGVMMSKKPNAPRVMKYWLTYWIIVAILNMLDLVGFLDMLYYPNVFQIVFCWWMWGEPWGAKTMFRRVFKQFDVIGKLGLHPRIGEVDAFALERACPYRKMHNKQD